MILLLLIFALFLIYLLCERIALNRYREKIPLRICVTGTRGKSSLVRLLASILRENGGAVLAKTTGSESRFILPDGSETEVPRRGIPSIIEQKSLLKKAVELKATSLVAEVMSIHPENHYVESQQIIQPNYVVITNVRADHIEAMGDTKDSIAEVFTADIPRHSQVYLIKAENKDCFIGRAKEADAELHTIASGFSEQFVEKAPQLKEFFSDTLDLVCGLAESLKIDTETIIRGLLNTKLDEGSSKTWRLPLLKDKRYIFCVNGFSANDPESTALLVEKIQNELGAEPERFVGLLHLRARTAPNPFIRNFLP